ncbi:MAG: hypothetical protein JWM18_2275 [Chloroflexi bacterium]|jgi:hypothetical protein|nr:hypothetical protein [Chloroflexota bacterium]
MAKQRRACWAAEPEPHDYPAAAAYLGLLLPHEGVSAVVDAFGRTPTTHHRANDLLRASQLPLLPVDDPEVVKDTKRMKAGAALAPVLLVRGAIPAGRPLTIADGYHRVCASYHIDEDADIPGRLVDLPA